MSGIDLRKAAVDGNDEVMRDYIVKQCNPCSVDEYGLSALHYAVWNGHIECVKLLACNTLGVDIYGKRGRSLELVSTMGYTALHLAALDCPKKQAQEIALLLLVAGANQAALSEDGKTPFAIATEVKNEHYLAAHNEFKSARTDKAVLARLTALKDNLNKNYCLQTNTKTRGTVERFDAKFTLPEFLFHDHTRTGNIPDELKIHEHQIRPLTSTGFTAMDGLEALNCLNFTVDQALVNKHRREHLLEMADPNFKPATVD